MNTLKTDLVVIGSGIAGLACSVTAAEKGADVILLEKRKVIGGNSRFAAGFFSCRKSGDPQQLSKEELYERIISYHRGQFTDPSIIRAYLDKSEDTVRWLEGYGLELIENGAGPNVGKKDTTTVFNIPKGTKRNGVYNAVQALHRRLDELGVRIFTESRAVRILKKDGRVSAVEADINGEKYEIETKAAVITTGGFTGNTELLKKYFYYYRDDYEGHMIPHAGDGLQLAADAGAALYPRCGMVRETQRDWAPSYLHFPLILALKRRGFLAVNQRGERVINENFISDESNMTCNILDQQPDGVVYIIYDDALIKEIDSKPSFGPMGPLPGLGEVFRILNQEKKGALIASDVEEAARWIGADPGVLRNTIETYSRYSKEHYDRQFFRKPETMAALETPPYYVLKIGALMIDTIGPIRINSRAEVLNDRFDPIPGLYCAGVAAGGWSSEDYCARYQFGSCIGFSVNFGRIAGENALQYIMSDQQIIN